MDPAAPLLLSQTFGKDFFTLLSSNIKDIISTD